MFVFVVNAYFYSFPKISLLVTHFLTLINKNSYDLSNAHYIKGASLSALHVLAIPQRKVLLSFAFNFYVV